MLSFSVAFNARRQYYDFITTRVRKIELTVVEIIKCDTLRPDKDAFI